MTVALTAFLVAIIGWIPTHTLSAQKPIIQARPLAQSLQPSAIPANTATFPEITAQHAIVIDAVSMQVLGEKASSEIAPQASITKLATLVESLKEMAPPIQSTESSSFSRNELRGVQSGVQNGEILSLRDAWAALLIPSANDVAEWLAGAYADRDAFLQRVVKSFADIGISMEMANASGLDEGTVGSRFSAKTSAELLHTIGSLPIIGDLSRTAKTTITPGGRSISLTSTNQLLLDGQPVFSGKTGTTNAAGQNLAVWIRDEGIDAIIVVLGSRDRYADTKSLLTWVRTNYSWHTLYPTQ